MLNVNLLRDTFDAKLETLIIKAHQLMHALLVHRYTYTMLMKLISYSVTVKNVPLSYSYAKNYIAFIGDSPLPFIHMNYNYQCQFTSV